MQKAESSTTLRIKKSKVFIKKSLYNQTVYHISHVISHKMAFPNNTHNAIQWPNYLHGHLFSLEWNRLLIIKEPISIVV